MWPPVETLIPSTVVIKSEPEDLDFMNSEEKRDLYLDSESPLIIEFPQITSSAIESEDSSIETIVCTPITEYGAEVGVDYEYKNGTRKSLRQQIQRISKGDKVEYIDSGCDYKTDRKSSHLKPQKQARTSEKDIWRNNTAEKIDEYPYKCDIGEKCFTRADVLTRHQISHTGDIWQNNTEERSDEYPHKCDMCEKTFTRADVLTRHERSHTGERPYKCRMCKMAFTRPDHLARHQTTHNEARRHKCDECGRYYSRLDVLIKHRRIHSGDRQFKCDSSENAFTKPEKLTRLKKSRRGEIPYKCNVCEKAFTRPDNLTRHNKIHNGARQVTSV